MLKLWMKNPVTEGENIGELSLMILSRQQESGKRKRTFFESVMSLHVDAVPKASFNLH